MFAAMLGISANLCAENLSTENIQRQKATSQYQAYLPAKYTVFEGRARGFKQRWQKMWF